MSLEILLQLRMSEHQQRLEAYLMTCSRAWRDHTQSTQLLLSSELTVSKAPKRSKPEMQKYAMVILRCLGYFAAGPTDLFESCPVA
jgi:hypothetical protein